MYDIQNSLGRASSPTKLKQVACAQLVGGEGCERKLVAEYRPGRGSGGVDARSSNGCGGGRVSMGSDPLIGKVGDSLGEGTEIWRRFTPAHREN
jgi:hypothetical protein